MALSYKFVIPPTGQADNAIVREMFEDIKAYFDAYLPSAGGAPANASFVTLGTDATLTSERVLTAGTAINITDNGAGSTVVIANTGVTSAIGTSNQVSVSSASGAVTFSLPQSIATTSSVQFGRVRLALGTSSAPALWWQDSGTDYGLDLENVGNFRFTTNHVEVANISSIGSRFSTFVSSPKLVVQNTGGSGVIEIVGPGSGAGYTLTLPTDDGTSDQSLTTNGSGVLSWATRAKTDLSNLASVAINTALQPGTPGTIDVGNTTYFFNNFIGQGLVLFEEATGTWFTSMIASTAMSGNVAYTLPAAQGASNTYLTNNGSGTLSWTNAAGTGTVNTGTVNRLAYYASSTNAVSAWSAITGSKALVSDSNGLPIAATTTATEIGYVSGVSSAIQTQIDGKASTALGNLASVAVNTSLLPAVTNSIDLGSSTKTWASAYLKTSLIMQQTGVGTNAVTLAVPSSVTSYTITLPSSQGGTDTILQNDGSGGLSWVSVSAAGGATKALDNLASVAINTSLLPGTDNSINLGSSTKRWASLFGKDLDAGASGTAGTVDVYPSTASKGKIQITAADNAGDTTTTLVNASQAGARTYTIPDAGASASFVMTEGTQTVNGAKTFGSAVTITTGTANTLVVSTDQATTEVSIDNTAADGDPFLSWKLSGTKKFSLGVNDGSSDVLQLGTTAIDTGTMWQATASGEITQPLQPAFLVTQSSAATNVTGDGTVYSMTWNAEVFDNGADFSSNTFTAPVTGQYLLQTAGNWEGILSTHTFKAIKIVTSNRTYGYDVNNSLATTYESFMLNVLADMDAGDTATVTFEVGGSTKVVDLAAGASDNYFCGSLIN